MTTHTPGPWTITLDCMDTFVSSRDGKTICEIAHSRDFTDPAKECCANARIIASAPDLLKALEFAAKIMHSDTSSRGKADYSVVRDAIFKARGES